MWDINFYQQALSLYTTLFSHKGIHSKKNFIDFIVNLSSPPLTHRAVADLLSGTGLVKNNHVTASLFDINGYAATDLIVFYNNTDRRVTLYRPRAENKFAEFNSVERISMPLPFCQI